MSIRINNIWPCHPRLLPDELLSSWIVRIAHAHFMKVQTFTQLMFGLERDLWLRDIDRMSPKWLTRKLALRTGTSITRVCQASLRSYQGSIYRQYHESGILHWILPLKQYHRTWLGFGLQFCPQCLAEDKVPYFRKQWRLAFYTVCPQHNAMMQDCCPKCGATVSFFRVELGKYEVIEMPPITTCHHCGFDLRLSPLTVPLVYEKSSYQAFIHILLSLAEGNSLDKKYDLGFFNVAHQLCKILLSKARHVKLLTYLESKLNVKPLSIYKGRYFFEECSLSERNHIIQLVAWVMVDPEIRIVEAWRANAVRYNVLQKDFIRQPQWYKLILQKCVDWRSK